MDNVNAAGRQVVYEDADDAFERQEYENSKRRRTLVAPPQSPRRSPPAVVLRPAEVQERIRSDLRFKDLVDKCLGIECLVQKVALHRAHNSEALYQSYLLGNFVQSLAASAPRGAFRPAYVLALPTASGVRFSATIGEGSSPYILAHVEVLLSWACSPGYSNLLVWLSPEGGAAIGVCCPRKVFLGVPWEAMHARIRSHLGLPAPRGRVQLLNGEDSNPFLPILWLHAAVNRHTKKRTGHPAPTPPPSPPHIRVSVCLAVTHSDRSASSTQQSAQEGTTQHVDVLETLRQHGQRENTIVGVAMYELHMVDHFLPTKAESLEHALQEHAHRRKETVADQNNYVDEC